MARLVNPVEMQLIYEKCKLVYSKELSPLVACDQLKGQILSSDSSIKIYFNIYSCMRKGICYKMGTSAAFTEFLLEKIYSEYGQEALFIALASAKQNADYRISIGNEQPGIEAVCREIIKKYNLPVQYENLEKYYGQKIQKVKAAPPKKKRVTKKQDDVLKIRLTYGSVVFSAEGASDDVLKQMSCFSNTIMPEVIKNSKRTIRTKKRAKSQSSSAEKGTVSVGESLRKRNPEIIKLKDKMDFKAKMIPLLFLAEKYGYQNEFTIRDIQVIMLDAIAEKTSKKQIEDVFSRRATWFEKTNQNPRKFRLLNIAKDYARNILIE